MEETHNEFRRQFFGISSEKADKQKDDPEDSKTETLDDNQKEKISVSSYSREKRKKKSTRDDLYANLPVREVLCKVPQVQQFFDYCNSEMVFMGTTPVREELRITPAKVERIRKHFTLFYICTTILWVNSLCFISTSYFGFMNNNLHLLLPPHHAN